MGKGRKRIPTAKLKLTGTYQPCRRINEPKLQAGVPSCPVTLDPEARAEWKRVIKEIGGVGVLSKADRAVFLAYCQSWSDFQAARNLVFEHGATYRKSDGSYGKNPMATVLNEARAAFLRFAQELGLTPAARSRVQAIPRQETADPLTELMNRKKNG